MLVKHEIKNHKKWIVKNIVDGEATRVSSETLSLADAIELSKIMNSEIVNSEIDNDVLILWINL